MSLSDYAKKNGIDLVIDIQGFTENDGSIGYICIWWVKKKLRKP
jgi:hypothetical protein